MTQNDGSFLYMPNMKSDQKNFRDLSEQPDSIDSTIHIWRVHRLRSLLLRWRRRRFLAFGVAVGAAPPTGASGRRTKKM
jgi:hypothetical protein